MTRMDIMDTHRAHTTASVADSFLKKNRTELLFVDGGMTPLLQPLDVYLNKSFKSKLKQKWMEWMSSGDVELTKGMNRKRASYETVCKWVQEAWDQVTPGMVSNSFVGCGLSSDRSVDVLHSGLQKLLNESEVSVDDSHTGITDDEDTDSDDEEGEMQA